MPPRTIATHRWKQTDLPRAGFPGPRRFQWAEGSGGNVPTVDLQRRGGRHGEALPRMLGVPLTKILTEPVDDEPEFRPLERRLESDIEFAVFDIQLDQLQPDRAVTERYETGGMDLEAQVGRLEMATFTEQRSPPHVECHAMRRHIARMMQQGTAGQQDAHPQPVRGRDKASCGAVRTGRVEQPSHVGSGRNHPTPAPGRRSRAPYTQETVADRETRFNAGFAQRIIAIHQEDPIRISGRREHVFHRFRYDHARRRHIRPPASSSTATSSRLVTTRSAPAVRSSAASL